MAEGLDVSQYPPMGSDLVAPVVGWLAHESCSVSGEMYVSMAGRVARAFIAESEGVYRQYWSIDDVGEQIDAISDPARSDERRVGTEWGSPCRARWSPNM